MPRHFDVLPDPHDVRDELGAMLADDETRPASAIHQGRELARHVSPWDRDIDHDKALPGDIVDDVEGAKSPAFGNPSWTKFTSQRASGTAVAIGGSLPATPLPR